MKIRFENSYWPNAIGVIGIALAIAFMVRACSDVLIEEQKTKQLEIQTHR